MQRTAYITCQSCSFIFVVVTINSVLFFSRLTVALQAEVTRSGEATPSPSETRDDKWDDLLDDLWERHLPYFRIRGYVVTNRPPSSSSFSGNVDPSSTILKELTRTDSDQNLLETLRKEPPQQKPFSPPPTTSETHVVVFVNLNCWLFFFFFFFFFFLNVII